MSDIHTNNTEDGDYKALGKIKEEDLQVHELLNKLKEEYNSLALEEQEEQSINSEDIDIELELTNLLFNNNESKVKKSSLLQKIMDLFANPQDENITNQYSDDIDIDSYHKKKEKRLLRFLFDLLKKLLANQRSIDLKKILDEQINKLMSSLEKESDPKLRQLLQERLKLLSELKAQLLGMKVGNSPLLMFKIIIMSAIIRATIELSLQNTKEHTQKNIERNSENNILKKQEQVINIEQRNLLNPSINNLSISNNFISSYYGKTYELSFKLNNKDSYILMQNLRSNTTNNTTRTDSLNSLFRLTEAIIVSTVNFIIKEVIKITQENTVPGISAAKGYLNSRQNTCEEHTYDRGTNKANQRPESTGSYCSSYTYHLNKYGSTTTRCETLSTTMRSNDYNITLSLSRCEHKDKNTSTKTTKYERTTEKHYTTPDSNLHGPQITTQYPQNKQQSSHK